MSYFNTTSLSGGDLKTANAQAKGQDERVLEHFKAHPSDYLNPDDVLEAIFTSSVPITSVRRSINTLTNGLFLEKTGLMKMGRYGKPTHTWRLRLSNTNQLNLL